LKIITIASAKGGVGKTTTAVMLAQALARRGIATLAVDLDPNNSLTDYFLRDTAPDTIERHSVLHVLTGARQAPDCIVPHELGLSVLGATPALATFATHIAQDGGAIMRLGSRLRKLDYDAVIIDTPPSLSPLLQAGLYAADLVLCPVAPHRWILQAAELMRAELERIADDTGTAKPCKVVYSMATAKELDTLQALGLDACATPIRKAAALAKAVDKAKPLPSGALHDAYFELSQEVYP
jgi:chromosome partitioning protein